MHRKVLKVFNEMSTPRYSSPPSAEYFLKLAVTYAAGLRRGFISKLTQLKRFDWLPPADAQRCVDRLESAVLMGGLSKEAEVNKEPSSCYKIRGERSQLRIRVIYYSADGGDHHQIPGEFRRVC